MTGKSYLTKVIVSTLIHLYYFVMFNQVVFHRMSVLHA